MDTRFYQDLDYGYAATAYKAQGSTADRSYVLATPHYDRHATYVALSLHREAATVYFAAEDFGSQPQTSTRRAPQQPSAEELQRRGREAWADMRAQMKPEQLDPEAMQRRARENWAQNA